MTKIRPEIQIKPGENRQVLTTVENKAVWASLPHTDIASVPNLERMLNEKAEKANTYTKEQTDEKISALVAQAPETLNTLNELAEALGNDPSFATTISQQIGNKVDLATVESKIQAASREWDAYRFKLKDSLIRLRDNFVSLQADVNETKIIVDDRGSAHLSIPVIKREPYFVPEVYLNGLLQEEGIDYTIAPYDDKHMIMMLVPTVAGDVVSVRSRITRFAGMKDPEISTKPWNL